MAKGGRMENVAHWRGLINPVLARARAFGLVLAAMLLLVGPIASAISEQRVQQPLYGAGSGEQMPVKQFGHGARVALDSRSLSEPSLFVAIDPVRVVDTRTDASLGLRGLFRPLQPRRVQMTGRIPTHRGMRSPVPPGATAVAINLTVVSPSHAGYLSVRPAGRAVSSSAPNTSNLNFRAGDTIPNLVISGLSERGQIEVTYGPGRSGRVGTDVVVDVVGYFVSATGFAGPPGADGRDGAPGQTGPPGPQGAPGIGAEGGPEVLSVRLKTGVIPSRTDGGSMAVIQKEDVGYYIVDMLRDISTCTLMATGVNYGTGLTLATSVSAGMHIESSKVVVRQSDGSGVATDGSATDGFDLLVLCLNDE